MPTVKLNTNNEEKEKNTWDAKKYESMLLANPRYSDKWISIAAKILADFNNISETSLLDFNADQLEVIYDLERYIKDQELNDLPARALRQEFTPEYNATQLRLKLTAYMRDVPPEIINKFIAPEIPYAKSNYLVQAYIDGHDMNWYVNFNHEQIYELYAGLVNGVDINKYDKKYISAEKMGVIRHALEIGLNVYYDKDSKTITIK